MIDPNLMLDPPPIPAMVGTAAPNPQPTPDEELAALQFLADTLPPLPTKTRRPKPTLKQTLDDAERLKRFWQPRNDRFERDQKLYELYEDEEKAEREADDVGDSGEVVILNDPFVIVEKLTNMLGSQEPTISVPPRGDPSTKDFAQRTEDMLIWWRDEASYRWQLTLHGPLTRDEAHYLCLRGWLVGRIVWNKSDPEFPWDYQVVDPTNVYPQLGKQGIEYVLHIYKATVADVRADFGYDEALLAKVNRALVNKRGKELDPDEEVEVVARYDDTWHQIVVNGKEIKNEAHDYGFLPWLIITANGSPIRATPWNKTKWVERVGLSVFEGIRGVYRRYNRVVSMLATEVSKMPNPAIVVYTDAQHQTQSKTIDTGPGATNTLIYDKEKFEVVETSRQAASLAQPLLQVLQDRLNRGSLPPVLWGEGAGTLSGFAVSLLSAGARDVVFPLVRAIEAYRSLLNRRVLQLYQQFGSDLPRPIQMVVTEREGAEGGLRRAAVEYKPDEVEIAGVYNEVRYRSLAPQDRAAMASVANLLVQAKIIDRQTARGEEFLGLQNPGLINERVLAEMAYENPEVVQLLIPWALQRQDPQLYAAYLKAELTKLQNLVAQLGQMSGATSGQEAQTARPAKGLPSNVVPPALMGEAPPPPEGAELSGVAQ